jgi:hypothetical protein
VTPKRGYKQTPYVTRKSNLRIVIEIAVAAVGGALLLGAVLATQQFLDRHFLPSWFLPRPWYVLIQSTVRVAFALAGVLLAFVARPRLGRLIASSPVRALQVIAAAVLALGAAELALRYRRLAPTEWRRPEEEPRRRPDPQLGWTLEPTRTGHARVGGREVRYAIDPAGYRVPRVEEPVDPARPAIVFAGESVIFGEGLTWEETVPAQVSKRLGVPSANISVHGYSTDQIYLRLQTELPRFRRPLAVVSLFMTALFGRNLDDDRPHLGPGLVWLPAQPASRLLSLAALFVPYHTGETVDRGVRVTREVLQATAALARARGATPLITVLQFGAEAEPDRALRQRIFDGADLPYVVIVVDNAWRLPWDRHPNARAAQAIAESIATHLGDPSGASSARR